MSGFETRTGMQLQKMTQPTAETQVCVFDPDGQMKRIPLSGLGIDPAVTLDDGIWGVNDPVIDDGVWV